MGGRGHPRLGAIASRQQAMAITRQEAWTERASTEVDLSVPDFVREVVEEVAFQARQDQKIDKRSGVSQRLPISLLENVRRYRL